MLLLQVWHLFLHLPLLLLVCFRDVILASENIANDISTCNFKPLNWLMFKHFVKSLSNIWIKVMKMKKKAMVREICRL